MKRFISFLGTGNYQTCRYRLDDKTSPVVTYVQTATSLFADPRCDEAVVFCTNGARAKHAAGLLAEFAANGLPPPQLVPIPDGASEAQLWEIFRIIRDAVGEGDEIVFDVTHSFRSLPVIATVLLRYLAVAKGVSLDMCLYGAYDKKDEESNVAPMFDLTPFFTLDDWTRAIDAFEEYGDPAALKDLATRRLGPLCCSATSAQQLNGTIKDMALFASNVRIANLGIANGKTGIRNMLLKSHVAHSLSNLEALAAIPELEPVFSKVVSAFSNCGDQDLRNGFHAAGWAARHGLLPQACTLLQESTISCVLEQNKDVLPCREDHISSREFVSGVLSCASSPKFDWNDWKPADTLESAILLKDRLSNDLLVNYAKLVRVRNAINHAGTNPQEPISPQGEYFTSGYFLTLAAAIESNLFSMK